VFENYNRRAGSERLEKLRGAWGDWIDNLFLAVGRSSTVAAATTKKSVSFNDVVSIFRTSERGNRSEVEVQTIKVATAPSTLPCRPYVGGAYAAYMHLICSWGGYYHLNYCYCYCYLLHTLPRLPPTYFHLLSTHHHYNRCTAHSGSWWKTLRPCLGRS
jgi:hypothetical protein